MARNLQIMVVDDEEAICVALSAWLTKEGYSVETAGSGAEALAKMERQPSDLYLVDYKMPGMDGLQLMAEIKARQPDAPIIMITAHGSIQSAVAAMKRGAIDYLCKPFDPEELSLLMERVAAAHTLQQAETAPDGQWDTAAAPPAWGGIVGQSEALRIVLEEIEEVAPTPAPVLITGETGTGKDLLAMAIHMRSEQAAGPFVAINCGAQSETLLESELFGHEKGAFTGAIKARRGRLEMADGGTLFLDEIGEISSKMQVALLRVLEEKKFCRLGGNQPIETRFRLISATHRDLRQLLREEQFREDFFYRINVLTIHIPPLRERLADVPVLADFFLRKYAAETGKPVEGLTPRAMEILMGYAWPGNVRELRNVIERVVVIARGRMIGAEELSFLQPPGDTCIPETATLKEMERRHLQNALENSDWNISRAAKLLDIDRVTLSRKMKRLNLKRP
ncbi:sigma-54-dependent transcriptional regulator [Desulfatitalea alkaliphila]|uniref:Sigma-54 dependent transcriptional regulator n=1 Tax=Desulfatitalea alkaliphila TaxID=2929485 RepID=A0AA41R1Z6_9BACT|nr:sigma-54 dependent transcriptional regulator [Desulfatitalea alkaliphila]MCJ8500193.1 sigma-54 dependent transcriptional regulator [Desulfatitalea alkaliphila]